MSTPAPAAGVDPTGVRVRRFRVRHRTAYRYAVPASLSRQILRLGPRAVRDRQWIEDSTLTITPPPTVEHRRRDAFGNPSVSVTLEAPHTELRLESTTGVTVRRPAPPRAPETMPWDTVFDRVRRIRSHADLEAMDVAFPTGFTDRTDALIAYAAGCFAPGGSVLDGAIALCTRIFEDFSYDGSATTVSTPASMAFERRRGVCQDFAHVMLAGLRGLGLPARYVSGYLLTHPPPGEPKLRGVDASHAWVSVYVPAAAPSDSAIWVDLDPTNGMVVGDEHITAAWGRDYADVAPVTGVVTGGGMQTVDVDVDVEEVVDRTGPPV